MASASAFAESARATRYTVFLSELFFKIPHRGYSAGFDVSEAALDSFEGFQLVEVVEKLLV
jgi:hypothetical protein